MDEMAAMRKAQFLLHYREARTRAITLTNCESGFKAAGIWPFNPLKGLQSRFIPYAVKKSYNKRPSTPPPTIIDPDVVITPYNRTLFSQVITTVSRSITVDRTVRTLFAKTGKAIDSHSVDIAAAQRKILGLTKQLDTFKKKQKKKQAVNSNLLFVGLQDIERANRAPITPATTFQPQSEDVGTRQLPIVIDSNPVDPFMAIADRFRSINNV